MKANVEIVTPKKAEQYLLNNKFNRPLSRPTVERYAGALLRGEWKLNGETILFDKEGALLNGQHRLHACVKSGVAFPTFVIRGLPSEVFDTLDGGKGRGFADVLFIDGEDNSKAIAAAARWQHVYDEFRIRAGSSASRAQLQETVKKTKSLKTSAEGAKPLYKGRNSLLASGPAIFIHSLLTSRDSKKAKAFFEQLADGTNLTKASPIYLLRERLLAFRGDKGRFTTVEILALILKAWVGHVTGRPIKVLRWKRNEAFPYLDAKGTGFVQEPDTEAAVEVDE